MAEQDETAALAERPELAVVQVQACSLVEALALAGFPAETAVPAGFQDEPGVSAQYASQDEPAAWAPALLQDEPVA